MRIARDIADATPLRQALSSELLPGTAVQDDTALAAYIRKPVRTDWHPVGTAGERPVRVDEVVRWHSSGVDQTLVATLEHPNGLLAQIGCSFSTGIHRYAVIGGSDGVIETTFPNDPPLDRPVLLQLKRCVAWNAVYERVEIPPAMDSWPRRNPSHA